MAFPKPKDLKGKPEPIKFYPGGREVLNLLTAVGKRVYQNRVRIAWFKQKGLCAICGNPLYLVEATADHIKPRKMGASERDDRQENIQAVHGLCNSQKGSKREGAK